MSNSELVGQLATETKKLKELHEKAERAKTNAAIAMEHDLHRTDGSESQDRRHEQHLQKMLDEERDAESAYEMQKKVVKDLTEQL